MSDYEMLKIAAATLLFAIGLVLAALGFKRAGDSCDAVLNGLKRAWASLIVWLGLSFAGAGLASGVVTYWLDAQTR